MTRAGHDRHPDLRHRRLPAAAGQRAAQRRLPDDPGAGAAFPAPIPETMASAVATPLEKQFSTIAGVDSMTSVSTSGQSHDHAAVLARPQHRRRGAGRPVGDRRRRAVAAVDAAQSADAAQGQPGRLRDPAARPHLARRSRCRSSTTTARTCSRSGISTISGVAQVQVFGSQQYAVRVQLDPNQLASRGIALTDVEAGDRQRERQPAHRNALRPQTARRRCRRPASSRARRPTRR